MNQDATTLCYLVVIVLSIVFLIWGFMELLKKKMHYEKTETQVISRQIRGIGLLLLSGVVLSLGGALCYGLGGGKVRMGRLKMSSLGL